MNSIESNLPQPENVDETESLLQRIEFIDALISQKRQEVQEMGDVIADLLSERHKHYDVEQTMFDADRPIEEQLYPDHTYNDTFAHGKHIVDDSGTAKGGDLNTRSGESYETVSYDNSEYAQKILEAAQKLGFVLPEIPPAPVDELDQQLGIADSNLEEIDHTVQAVIVPTAKGISNPMRIRSALRDIESGKIHTDTLIIASCERPVDDAERAGMESRGLHYGATEYESAVAALGDMSGEAIDYTYSEPFSLKAAPELSEGRMIETKMTIGDQKVNVIVVSAPFNSNRIIGHNDDGTPRMQNRASTQDNFLAALEFLPEKEGDVVMESHDTWIKSQSEVAEQFMGVRGKRIIPAGPHKLDRLEMSDGKVTLNQPAQVVDEIAKTYAFKVQTVRILENQRAELIEKVSL